MKFLMWLAAMICFVTGILNYYLGEAIDSTYAIALGIFVLVSYVFWEDKS